ncbi:hypothetical protein PWJ90_38010 [Nocardia gipuzkoensis]|nr:hypothetical protein [Nocardia gipuzkoensis]MDE1675391.1 hypothetical protein [Nocardia gipuzkoensis]
MAYRRRNVVERCFNRLEQYRAIATRYDKTAQSYRPRHPTHVALRLLDQILAWSAAMHQPEQRDSKVAGVRSSKLTANFQHQSTQK